MEELLVKPLVVGQLQTNCYLVMDTKRRETVIIDPGDDATYIADVVREEGMRPTHIIATHGHFDHILGAFELQQAYDIPFLIHQKDDFLVKRMKETARHFLGIDIPDLPPEIKGYVKETDEITVCAYTLHVLETPGHTPGSICLYSPQGKFMLTGDTLFAEGAVGRTDFAYSSFAKLRDSISNILSYPEETILYPGHGDSTTVHEENKHHIT